MDLMNSEILQYYTKYFIEHRNTAVLCGVYKRKNGLCFVEN